MKKLLIVILCLFLFSCSGEIPNKDSDFSIETIKVDMSAYKGIYSFDHNFKEVSGLQLDACLKQGGSGIFYIGRSNCKYCNELCQYINEVAQELNVYVYYIDTESNKFEFSQMVYDILFNDLKETFTKEDGEPVFLTPEVLTIINGKIAKYQISCKDWDVGNPSEKQIKKIKKIYKKMFEVFVEYFN